MAVKNNKLSVLLAIFVLILGAGAFYHYITVSELEKTLRGKEHEVNVANDKMEDYKNAALGITPEAVLTEVNKLRAEVGVAPLELDERLNASATAKARDMANNDYFDHKNPRTGKDGWTYVFDYLSGECRYAGENIATTTRSDADAKHFVLNQWKGSKPHYEGMINPKYRKIGFGIAYNKDLQRYAVQHFCGPR